MAPKVWLITGASSGFGRIMTELALDSGDICVATSIDPPALADLFPKYGKERLRLLHTDVTQLEDVVLAFNIAEQTYGHVDYVFNNAGVTVVSEVEGTPENKARDMFEVNFWGSANVTREAVRVFREVNGAQRGGKLLQMTSAAAIGGWATIGYYGASKHAVQGLTKALLEELNPDWNIQVMLIEPGFMRTPIFNLNDNNMLPAPAAYAGLKGEQTRSAFHPSRIRGDARKAMELVHRVARQEKLPLHLPIGEAAIALMRKEAAQLIEAADIWESAGAKDVLLEE